ncbi:MAG: hypothetical protein ACRBBW_20855 [Cellvibrionaceae bacterium]
MGVADTQFSELTKKEWRGYQEDFYPWEDKAVDFAMNSSTVDDAQKKVHAGISAGYDNVVRSELIDVSKYGISDTAREATTRKRRHNLSKTAALVSGLNQSRAHVQDLQRKVMAGDMASGLSGSRLQE